LDYEQQPAEKVTWNLNLCVEQTINAGSAIPRDFYPGKYFQMTDYFKNIYH